MSKSNDPRIKTYVLVCEKGEDDGFNLYRQRDDVIILQPKPGETIEQVAAKIQGPANVILQAHGETNGTFQWHQDERVPYSQFFQALPRSGILSVTLGSCYGGIAQREDILSAAPPGTLVLSMTGPQTSSVSSVTVMFAKETWHLTRPVDLYIKALDNFDSDRYREYMTWSNQTYRENEITDPNEALPHILGIGGDPPQPIDLANQLGALSGQQNAPAFQRAVQRVQELFDTVRGRTNPVKGGKWVIFNSLGPEAERKLDDDIAAMAQKLARGDVPKNAEEKRIAYALTAAYLDESGELQRMINKQPGYQDELAHRDANGKLIDPNAPLHRATGITASVLNAYYDWKEKGNAEKGITHDEQAYINSVAKKLEDNPAMKGRKDAILEALVADFSKSGDSDTINHGLADTLKQAGISTRGWEQR